jgi:S-adenosylmethionine synthetase
MMFGFACDETETYMPMPIHLAHRLAERLAYVRRTDELGYLRPDGKTQVTVRYEDDEPVEVTKVLLAAQHKRGMNQDDIRSDLIQYVVDPIIPPEMCSEGMDCLVNRTGVFEIGGPQADSGVTGRKIIVDTYGGYSRHGGGAFSGKDPTKVDRSGAYFARYVAKNVVAAGLARKCEIQVAYAIGDPEPFSIAVFCFGTETIPEQQIAEIIGRNFDFSPLAMIDHLKLRRPIYRKTAAYGHFGRDDKDFTWERLDAVDMLRDEAGL